MNQSLWGVGSRFQGLQCSAEVENRHPSFPWGFYYHSSAAICKEQEGTLHKLSACYASDLCWEFSLYAIFITMPRGTYDHLRFQAWNQQLRGAKWLAQGHLNPSKWWGWEVKQGFLVPNPMIFQFPQGACARRMDPNLPRPGWVLTITSLS